MRSKEIDEILKRISTYKSHKLAVYGLILKQCSKPLRTKLETRKDWETLNTDSNGIALLKAIRDIVHGEDENIYYIFTIHKALSMFFSIEQQNGESATDYAQRFSVAKDQVEIQAGKNRCVC